MDDMSVSGRDRQVLFQNLKPCCVKISQLAIRDLQLRTPLQELVGLTGQLLVTLEEQVGRDPALLEEKLAEYVFFPLYHIFCQMKRFPESVVENSIKCLRILIIYGWKSKISAKMVQQILILVIFIIDGPPGSHHRRKPPEETVLEAFRTQTALLNTAALSATAASGLSAQEVVPVLGHGITVMLDGAVDGASPPIQLEALYSLRAVYGALKEHEALASFLPGTISLLTKFLSMPNRYKMKVLAESVHTVQIALTHVLGDVRTRAIFPRNQSEEPTDHGKPKTLSPAWLQGTVAQVKVALAKIMKLRTQEKPLLRKALGRLCIALIDECHITLESCAEMLVETAMILDSDLDTADMTQPNLSHLVNIYPKLGETVKTIVYNWLSRLSRVMQMGDDDTRKVAIHDLGNGIDLCRRLSLESTSLDDILSVTLKDSMVALILSSPKQLDYEGKSQLYDGTMSLDLSTLDDQFQPIILSSQSQKDLKMEWTHLLDRLGSKSQKAQLAASLMEFVRESSSVDRTAAMWLCFQLVKRSGDFDGDADGFLDLSIFGEAPEDADAVLNGLYNFAVQAINCHTELASEDWACQALSLEVIAFAAEKAGRSFRPELIDVLFPIATFFGSENVRLRQHAIVTLNRIASSVQYPSVSDLIIDNADYMINSVALRLNTLDISPASMQVLLMMTRLTGSHLVPFLDDVVDSILAALDSFHGHTSFTESLFTTLKEISDQISGVDQRLLCHHELAAVDHRKQRQNKDEMKHLLDYLDRRAERLARDAEEAASQRLIESHPKEPWKSETATEANGADLVDQQRTSHHDEKPPSSPTYQLLLRIVYLAEHYLTSPSPKLRRSLLELLATASRTLAGNEDSFLPAVNAIWPGVISRLRDPETFIIVEACHTLSSLCETAGDFLSSRFQTEWTNGLHEWCCKVKQQNSNESVFRATKKGNPGAHGTGNIVIPIQLADGIGRQEAAITARTVSGSGSLEQHSSAAKVWEAVVQLLTSILSFVNVTEAMFDEILDILYDVMEVNKDVREALETIDADAVWLIRYARGYIDPLPAPQMEGAAFVPMEKMPRCCE